MFCYQCEQTAKGTGCTKVGVCGKKPEAADLQDLLVHALKGLAQVNTVREGAPRDKDADAFFRGALFATLTNVNFDPERLADLVREAVRLRDELAGGADLAALPGDAATFTPVDGGPEALAEQGGTYGVDDDPETDPDIKSLKDTVVYGLKGVAAYADHAGILGESDPELDADMQRLLAETLRLDLSLEDWLARALDVGRVNLRAMELLDAANTGTYGHPEPTEVPLGHRKGKAIVVSGHDLKDLKMLLEQTEGTGITVYTHGEMLPCHGYPELKRYEHFHGHYGTAWQNQQREFDAFPGAVLMTTNCIQKPRESYAGNIFTTGEVAWPGAEHIHAAPDGSKDFSRVIQRALDLPGFAEDEDAGSVMAGFGRNAVTSVAPAVVDAVKSGAIRHFFLVGGCDGANPGRNYYTDFVDQTPDDTVVLTLACGKFRFFDHKLGDIGGIPRLLDVGQCNDAYSAIQIALALAEAFDCGVNDLPLSLVLSWYEQKAVAILLTLLHLGIKDMRLGPSLPAFLSENVLNALVENYGIKPIATPEEDLAAILG